MPGTPFPPIPSGVERVVRLRKTRKQKKGGGIEVEGFLKYQADRTAQDSGSPGSVCAAALVGDWERKQRKRGG